MEYRKFKALYTLIVEQMAQLALWVPDWAYVLEHGRIVRQGCSAELFSNPCVLSAYFGPEGTAVAPDARGDASS
jgi:ABC-type branched-subunit amino acid transport system ATPase component